MSRYFPSARTLALFAAGLAVGVLGILLARIEKLPTSLSEVEHRIAGRKDGSLSTNACVPGQKDDNVYFVSCGGFF